MASTFLSSWTQTGAVAVSSGCHCLERVPSGGCRFVERVLIDGYFEKGLGFVFAHQVRAHVSGYATIFGTKYTFDMYL